MKKPISVFVCGVQKGGRRAFILIFVNILRCHPPRGRSFISLMTNLGIGRPPTIATSMPSLMTTTEIDYASTLHLSIVLAANNPANSCLQSGREINLSLSRPFRASLVAVVHGICAQ